MWQCLDLYVSLVCRLHREYIVAFFVAFFLSFFFFSGGWGGGGGAGFCSCRFVFFRFLFVRVCFSFFLSFFLCLVCLFSVVC